jgi:serine/threonine protein kinase
MSLACRVCRYFEERRDVLRWPSGAKNDDSVQYVRRTEAISDVIPRKHDSFYDLIKEMLRADPDRRCTAKEAMKMPYFTEAAAAAAGGDYDDGEENPRRGGSAAAAAGGGGGAAASGAAAVASARGD